MRSIEARRCLAALAATLLLAGTAPAAEPGARPTRAEVRAAVAEAKADPNLAETRKERTLRWKEPPKPDEPPKPNDSDMAWIRNLGRWLSQTGRLLVWVLGALGVALVLVSLRRWVQWRADNDTGDALHLPSHVRDLDIRPDSLPNDIGAAARALWESGNQRQALSLLYRGALSRLVHRHAVPIRAASTEGECVRLSARVLPAAATAFFERLVLAWQTTVYAGRLPEAAQVLALCAEFDSQLGSAEPPAGTVQGARP